MTSNQLKQIQTELLELKLNPTPSVTDKERIQKLQQSLDNILNQE